MSAALKLPVPTSSETSRSERGHAPANDNVPHGYNAHLHLVADNTEGTYNKLSRSVAFLRLTKFHLIIGGDLTTYTYDLRGKVSGTTNAAITGDDRTYNYDDLGRLTSATGSWGTGAYTYDALGNMRTKTVGCRALVMSYDGDNKLTSHTDSGGPNRTLGYDARGNVTALGGLNFTYDMSDQPTAISGTGPNGAASGTYTYDGNLKRVKSTVNGKTIYNIYDAGGTLVHIDAVTDGKATDYIGKIARITTSGGSDTVTYLHADQLGSANTGTDALGLVLWREQYTPFGTTLTSPLANNDQAGFTGHIKDSATGLNYMQARYYDPLIGRFLSRDPIGFSVARPEMFGSYTYVNNDPVNMVDATGKQAINVWPGQAEAQYEADVQAIKGFGSAFRGLYRTGKHLTREYVIAPNNARVNLEVKAENLKIDIAVTALKNSPKLRAEVARIVADRIKENPNFATGRLLGGATINVAFAEVSAVTNSAKLGLASKVATGGLIGFLAASGDAREMVHQGITNPVNIVEGAIFGNLQNATQSQEKVTCTGSRIKKDSC